MSPFLTRCGVGCLGYESAPLKPVSRLIVVHSESTTHNEGGARWACVARAAAIPHPECSFPYGAERHPLALHAVGLGCS